MKTRKVRFVAFLTLALVMLFSVSVCWGKSLLDLPEKGLYYAIIENDMPHLIKLEVIRIETGVEKNLYARILPPKDFQVPRKTEMGKITALFSTQPLKHAINVFPIRLPLGDYKIKVNDLEDNLDELKIFPVRINEALINSMNGPIMLSITNN